MAFRNEITAGTTLIREAIQSQGYEAGTSGWVINSDGSAEFNNVVIRGGTIVSGTSLYYNGTPGPGTLIMSISAAAGTDAYGNAYVAGVGVYGVADSVTVRNSNGDMVRLRADSPSYVANSTSPGLELRKASDTGDGASITEYDDTFDRGLVLLSPSPVNEGSGGEDFAYLQMTGRFSTDPSILLFATGPDSVIGLNQTVFDGQGVITGYAGAQFNSYTPSLGGAGGATYSNRTGWWQRVGPMIFFSAYFVVSGAGSGTSMLTLTAPTNIDRTARQSVIGHAEAMSSGNNGSVSAVAFTTGSGKTFDRIRNATGTNMQGSDITASSILNFTGWYREA